MSKKIKCPICEKEFQGDTFENCPYCDWCYQGFERDIEQDEYNSINHTTIAKAKENLSKGLNIWGEPLPKK